jgi:replication-associated recombination protein RarA
MSDPWWGTKTIHGLPADEIRSSLQKYVRRGMLEEAILTAYELYSTSEEAEDLLWRRIEIMGAEDVGMGSPGLPANIEALHAQRGRFPRGGERFLIAAHAVRLLVLAPKDRTSAELSDWAQAMIDGEERPAEVIDVAVDMHTQRGVEMGRGKEHFYSEGNVVANEIPDRDLTWLNVIRASLGSDSVVGEAHGE